MPLRHAPRAPPASPPLARWLAPRLPDPPPAFPSQGRRGLREVTVLLGGSRQSELLSLAPETATLASLQATCGPAPIVLRVPGGEVTLRSEADLASVIRTLLELAE